MKKIIIMFITIITITLTISVSAKPVVSAPKGFYPHMAQITKVVKVKRGKYKGYRKVTSVDGAGRIWEWYDDEEYWVKGDFAALEMWDHDTPKYMLDDWVVDARYVGYKGLFK